VPFSSSGPEPAEGPHYQIEMPKAFQILVLARGFNWWYCLKQLKKRHSI